MSRDQGLDQKMELIAHFVADKILGNEIVDKDTLDAVKVLTGYWTAASKLDKVAEGEDDTKSGAGFKGIKDRIANAGRTEQAEGDRDPGVGGSEPGSDD